MNIVNDGISVVICCFNGALRLPETLKSLGQQKVPAHIPWEILIIDNASTDDTAKIAAAEWAKYALPGVGFRILEERTPGKNFAFKVGINEASYSFILTCDDDNWLNPDYITLAFEIMQSDQNIGALGGCGIFEPEQPVNEDILTYKDYYVNGPQTWAERDHWVYGAGSVYRKKILTDAFGKGWQQITSGRAGSKLISGEDPELCFIIYLSGFKIIADDRLVFKHFVPQKRQDLAYIINLAFWLNYSAVLLNSYYPLMNKDERPIEQTMNKWFKSATKTFIKQLVLFNYRKTRAAGKITVEQKLNFYKAYGTWSGLLNERKKVITHHKKTKALLGL